MSWPRLKDTRSGGFVGYCSIDRGYDVLMMYCTRLYERRKPEVPGVLKTARGYLLTEAMTCFDARVETGPDFVPGLPLHDLGIQDIASWTFVGHCSEYPFV